MAIIVSLFSETKQRPYEAVLVAIEEAPEDVPEWGIRKGTMQARLNVTGEGRLGSFVMPYDVYLRKVKDPAKIWRQKELTEELIWGTKPEASEPAQ